MKDYKRSSYAANKSSENIVYKSEVSNDVDITLEKFLASDPTLTEADFVRWKKWSDENYREDEINERRTTRKDVSFESMTEVVDFIGTTLEEEYENREIERLQKAATAYAMFHLYSDIRIPEQTLKRFEKYYFKGMKIMEISRQEGIRHSAVRKSIDTIMSKLVSLIREYFKENHGDIA